MRFPAGKIFAVEERDKMTFGFASGALDHSLHPHWCEAWALNVTAIEEDTIV